jgi:hypothetical protein
LAYVETALYCDSVAYNAIPMWTASTVYTVGQIVRQRAAPAVGNERCFICVIAGTSLASEPSWSTSARGAGTVESGGPKWYECSGHPAINGDPTNVGLWKASTSVAPGSPIIKNTALTHYFMCDQVSGTTGATEPTWNTTPGASTSSGGTTWTCLGPVSAFTTRWAAPAARLVHLLNNNQTWLANAGMTIYVGDDHAESFSSGSPQYINGFECKVICIDHTAALPATSADLRTTASITAASGAGLLNFGGATTTVTPLYVYGLQLIYNGASSTGINLGYNSPGTRIRFEQCLFYQQAITASAKIWIGATNPGPHLEFSNCTFRLADPTQFINFVSGAFRLDRCVFILPTFTSSSALFGNQGTSDIFIVEGCDLSVIGNGYLMGAGSQAHNGYALFKDCKLPDTLNLYKIGGGIANMQHNALIDFVRCDSSGASYRSERYDLNGAETISSTIVRSSGSIDGATPVSHQVATTVNASNTGHVFNAMSLAIPNAVIGTRTVTLYGIVNDSRLPNNDEVWADVEFLGSPSSPRGSFVGNRALMLAAAAPLAADTSAWDSMVSLRNAGPATWNPFDKSTSASLTNNNLTANLGAAQGAVRGVRGRSSGKYYLEYTMIKWAGDAGGPGVALASASFSGNATTAGIIAVAGSNGTIWVNGSAGPSFGGTPADGDIVCMAIDFDAALIWFRQGVAGNWNGSGTANPATGVGGVSLAALAGATLFPFFIDQSTDSITANFGGSAFTGTIPSGFSAWNVNTNFSQVYAVGQAIKVASNPGRVFWCSTAGTSGASEPAGSSSVTLNPSDKDPNITLSGGNLVATLSSGSQQGVRANVPKNAKYYFEVKISSAAVGIGAAGVVGFRVPFLTAWTLATSSAYMSFASGSIFNNSGTASASIGGWVANDVLCVAVDMVSRQVWFRRNGGNWVVIDVSGTFLTTAPVPFCVFQNAGAATQTFNLGGTAFAQTPPSGFPSATSVGFDNAVDSETVADGAATFRAGCRFKQALTITPQQAGDIYVYPKFGRASMSYLMDPAVYLS